MSCAEARRIVGADAIVGVTCHASRHLAMQAAETGADYVAFGAFFPTDTKDPPASADPRDPPLVEHADDGALRCHRWHHR